MVMALQMTIFLAHLTAARCCHLPTSLQIVATMGLMQQTALWQSAARPSRPARTRTATALIFFTLAQLPTCSSIRPLCRLIVATMGKNAMMQIAAQLCAQQSGRPTPHVVTAGMRQLQAVSAQELRVQTPFRNAQ
jgi:hypothetical protein